MKIKEKKPGHFEIEAWNMLLLAVIMIIGLFIVVKCFPYYRKYKAEKQQVQQETTQHSVLGKPDNAK